MLSTAYKFQATGVVDPSYQFRIFHSWVSTNIKQVLGHSNLASIEIGKQQYLPKRIVIDR